MIAVSGCLRPETDGPRPEAEPSTQPRTSTDDPDPANSSLPDLPITPVANNTLAFSECSAWQLAWTIPPAANPGSRPSGWEPADETTLLGGIDVSGYRCNRIAIGPFERGPIHFIIETHYGTTFPPECIRGGGYSAGIATTFWIDDEEIATYINATYGIPTLFAAIETVDEVAGGIERHTWSWAQAGQQQSTVTLAIHSVLPVSGEDAQRWFWAVGEGLVMLQTTFEVEGTDGPTNGMFRPPMLMSEIAGGAYAGLGAWQFSGDGEGEFVLFRDRFCEEPVP